LQKKSLSHCFKKGKETVKYVTKTNSNTKSLAPISSSISSETALQMFNAFQKGNINITKRVLGPFNKTQSALANYISQTPNLNPDEVIDLIKIAWSTNAVSGDSGTGNGLACISSRFHQPFLLKKQQIASLQQDSSPSVISKLPSSNSNYFLFGLSLVFGLVSILSFFTASRNRQKNSPDCLDSEPEEKNYK